MRKVPLKLAKAGMIVAQPVQREDGLVLVGVGAELTDAIIKRLMSGDIKVIAVQGNPVELEGSGDYKSLLSALDVMFSPHLENKFMMGLKNIFKQYFARKVAEQDAHKAPENAENEE